MAALESLDAVVVVDEMDHPPPDASDRQPRRVARYIYSNSCSKIRTCWRLQLDGKYSFLDGLVSSGMCDQDKRPYSLWGVLRQAALHGDHSTTRV